MMRLVTFALALLVVASSGCSSSRRGGIGTPRDGGPVGLDAPGTDAGPMSGGGTLTFVVSSLDIGASDPSGDPNIAPGVDLDGRVSDDTDPIGCFKRDFRSPPPDSEVGVDNQLGPMLDSVGGSIDVSGAIADAIASGDLLLLVEVRELNDPVADDFVQVEMWNAAPSGGSVVLDASGRPAAGQSFVALESLGSADGFVSGGRVVTTSDAWSVPFSLGEPTTPLTIQPAELRFTLGVDAFHSGVLGGGIDVEQMVALFVATSPDIPEMLARTLLENQADLAPDDTGQCRSISFAYVLEGATAFRTP